MASRKSSALLRLATLALMGLAYLATRRRSRTTTAPKGKVYSAGPATLTISAAVLLAADLWAIPAVLRGKTLISADELKALLPAGVPRYDRLALSYAGERAEHYRHISDRVLAGLVAGPLLLAAAPRIRAHWAGVAALYVWAHALTYTLYSFSPLGPAFIDKFRPVVYYTGLPEAIRNPGNNRNARFSGHTANGACAAFFAATVLRDFGIVRGRAGRAAIYLAAFLPAMLLGWLRTRALKHFPSDVAQAILIGGSFGILTPRAFRMD